VIENTEQEFFQHMSARGREELESSQYRK